MKRYITSITTSGFSTGQSHDDTYQRVVLDTTVVVGFELLNITSYAHRGVPIYRILGGFYLVCFIKLVVLAYLVSRD